MDKLRVEVPAIHRHDLVQLRKLFFDEDCQARFRLSDPESRKKGVRLVHCLTGRGSPPHAVTSTADLIDATLEDMKPIYRMAIQDFVTGFTDINQSKKRKRSMFEIGKELGIPAELISVRNNIAHGYKPGLTKLRLDTSRALKWLWKEYWLDITTTTEGPDSSFDTHKSTFNPEEMEEVLLDFEKRTTVNYDQSDNSFKLEHVILPVRLTPKTSKKLIRICGDGDMPLQTLVKRLLQEGRMIPQASTETIGDREVQQYGALVRALVSKKPKFGTMLLKELANRLTLSSTTDGMSPWQATTVKYWLIYFMAEGDEESGLKGLDEAYESVVNVCAAHPGPFTFSILCLMHEKKWYDCTEVVLRNMTLPSNAYLSDDGTINAQSVPPFSITFSALMDAWGLTENPGFDAA